MSFAHPWALALAALAAPLVAMYLYRAHRQRRQVASAILLRVIRDERPAARSARSKLRHRLSLVLALAALLLAIVALAGPRSSDGRPSRVVIVLDRSASMATRDDNGQRLAAATEALADVVARAGADDEIALVAAGGEPGLIVAPTRTHADIEAAADAIVARGAFGDNRGDEAVAFRLAAGLCSDREHTRVVVISDGAGLSVPPLHCPLETITIGRPADNVGIAGMSVRSVDGLGSYDVHLAVASSDKKPRKVDVELTVGGHVIDVMRFDVAPAGDAERTVRIAIPEAATPSGTGEQTLLATLGADHRDALALDDRAEVTLTSTGPVSVLLVTNRPNSLVAEALRLHPRVELSIAEPAGEPTTEHDLVVLETMATTLPPSRHVVGLGVAVPDAPLTLGAEAARRTITRWDFDAPWFRYVDLRSVIIGKAHTVNGGRSIVDSDGGPLVAAAVVGQREVLVTGFAIDATDLTLRAAFPNVIANLVEWAAPTSQQARAEGVLSAAESHLTPRLLPTSTSTSRGYDAPWFARLAVLLALVLLAIEQVLYVRRTA